MTRKWIKLPIASNDADYFKREKLTTRAGRIGSRELDSMLICYRYLRRDPRTNSHVATISSARTLHLPRARDKWIGYSSLI